MLDAYWSGGIAGSKLKSRIMERMKRVNKISCPQPLTGRTKTPGHQGGLRKNRQKKDTSKLVLIVQETEKPETACADSCRNLSRTNSKPLFSPTFAKPAAPSLSSKRPSANVSVQSACGTARDGLCRDASAYLLLREQLDRLTMEIQGDCSGERREESVSLRKQRRTRKERGKGNLKRDTSMITEDVSAFSLRRGPSILNSARGSDRPTRLILDTTFKNTIEDNKRGKPSMSSSKKILDKGAKENAKSNPGQRLNLARKDPNGYVARKYLGDLYTRIMFKARNIERSKKTAPKKSLEKCPSSRHEFPKLQSNPRVFSHAHKKSLQYNERIKKICLEQIIAI
eukprot:TRINITY_DN11184_c0_g1_i8.p1 TRINITY_DN11184_c0_g1~~TRINITY_DN11184_c0_g1_i8.p1  ORF type:complete len:341 (-),score=58.98 TRINITY_DN11184_c0_g1_i8:146-1168(-)